MLNFFIIKKFRKTIIAVFIAITLTGGSGDLILNYLAASGDIYDYTILKTIYDHKEELKELLDKIKIEDIKNQAEKAKEIIQEVKKTTAKTNEEK